MTTERFYKWLHPDGSSCHGGTGLWSLPTKNPDGSWTPGAPRSVTGPLVPCENGIHLCRESDLVHWCAPLLCLAQYRGERVDADTKIVVRAARMVQVIETWNARTARLFACDCAEHVQPTKADPRSLNAIVVARRFANNLATTDELAAARDAAWDARDAAWAARDAAWDAAWAAGAAARVAGAAAWAAARVARDAAWAAGAAERQRQTHRLMQYLRGALP